MLEGVHLSEKESEVRRISPDSIDINPENPRLIFNEKEDMTLLESIDEVGILVPLIVFPDKPERYTLLDGERRLRCARRLNLKTVPANIIAKPTRIENILRMFNIHNIREQWKLMPTALKLQTILEDESFRNKSKREIAKLTGLTVATVDRCRELLDLDKKYQGMILEYYRMGEPSDFKFSEDFFLEMNRALNSLRKFQRDLYERYTRSGLIDRFVEKRKQNVITDIIDFRKVRDIIGATRKGVSEGLVKRTLNRLLEETEFSIQDAYEKVAEPAIKAKSIEDLCQKLIEELEVTEDYLQGFSKRKTFAETLEKVLKIVRKTLAQMKAQ
jgi:ParB family chromosome partitioning protein